MVEKQKDTTISVDSETYARLKLLSSKSGFSMAYMIRELSRVVDFLPSCDRIILGIFPKAENRSVLFIVNPMWCGNLGPVSNNVPDSDVSTMIKRELERKVTEQ